MNPVSSGASVGAPDADGLLDQLTTAVLVLDADGMVHSINAGAEALFSISGNQAVGRPLTATVPALAGLVELAARSLQDGQGYGRVFAPDRAERMAGPAEIMCRVVPLDAPGEGLALAELFDATAWRQIDREHALLNQHDVSRRMIRQLAHEVRNPLGGLRGAAQLLDRQLGDPRLREYTRVIIGEADRLVALTDNLLGPAHAAPRKPHNVHQVLERVITLIEAERGTRIDLLRDYDPSLPEILANPDQLIQATLNIARNAVQALDGHGRLTFRTRALSGYPIGTRRHRLVVSIEIEDDGPGVPEELAESIFYPLVTGRGDGTGLGLSIAQDLVNRHGGLIEYQSRPGCTVFMVRIPVDEPAEGVPGDE